MKDCYETNEANNFWLHYVGMIIIKVLISKDFLVILAFQNGYMCNTGLIVWNVQCQNQMK